MSTPAPTETEFIPPYISFRTFLGLLDRMKQEDPPARIDKSYLDNLSGGYRTQVLAALHSLGLVSEGGQLSGLLLSLVRADEDVRKKGIEELVRACYAPVVSLSPNSTQQQMIDAFAEMAPSVTGDTRRKAIAFFLNACNYSGMTVSKHWKTPRVPPSGRKREKVEEDAYEEEESDSTPADRANTRRLELRSGGVVTLGLSVDLFALSSDDREFVFGLIDKMSAYENQRALPAVTGIGSEN